MPALGTRVRSNCSWNTVSPFEIVVEVDEDGMECDLAIIGSVPVIHVGFETLTGTIAIETEAIVETTQS